MYQYSMLWFINIFKKSLNSAEKSKKMSERLKNISNKFREIIYFNICNSIQDKDRILFVSLKAIRLLLHEKEITNGNGDIF